MKEHKNFSHFAPVFEVQDMEATLAYYQKLGFETTFKWQEPVDYAIVKRGAQVAFHFSKSDQPPNGEASFRSIYIFVYDVDALYQEFKDKEIPNLTVPQDRDYGMRDFDLKDLNGYNLTFGKSINDN